MKRQYYKLPFIHMILKDYLLNGSIKPLKIKKDEIIYSEGEICNSICYILEGTIKGVRTYSDGHESIIRVLTKNNIIGLALIFSSIPNYNATFSTTTDSIIYKIPKEDLIKLIQQDREFAEEFLTKMSDNSIELNNQIRLLSYKTIRERLSYFLYKEYVKNNSLSFRISYTKTELADLVNVERSSLSYEMHKMIEEGILSNKGHNYTILDIKKIEEAI